MIHVPGGRLKYRGTRAPAMSARVSRGNFCRGNIRAAVQVRRAGGEL